ncbi:MAG TPA: hydroxymethylglutaryl-CoA synthase family protein [Halobacteria archaeon]|nr:hydroxymethylglutaryl-CoA synthase family protein [Halobacteria archaeon]
MTGIVSYGSYIPLYRIDRTNIYMAMGWLNPASMLPGEKAAASYDEDSVTMAVNAGIDCLTGFKRESITGLYFATTTPPFLERQNSGIISTALDLSSAVRTEDFTNSIKSGTSALISAYDSIEAGTSDNILVCSSDCRLGKPGGYLEEMYGDSAASLLIGKKDEIAEIKGNFSISYDFVDHWRAKKDKYNRNWEDRWIRDEGYGKFITELIFGLLRKYDLKPDDFSKVCYPCMYERAHTSIGTKMGFGLEQIQGPLFTDIGNIGTPYPLLILISALEEAKPGDRILLASYGNGGDAVYFEVTDDIDNIKSRRKGVKKMVESKQMIDTYEKYAVFKDLLEIDKGGRGEEAFTSLSTLWRERKAVLGLVGSKCKQCGTPQFPPQKVCVKCGAVDKTEEYRFSDKKGTIFTYTGDNLTFTPNPPAIYGFVDFNDGGRYMFDFTDCELDSLKVGMPVEMSFRRKYADENRGIYGYFWKAVPIRE